MIKVWGLLCQTPLLMCATAAAAVLARFARTRQKQSSPSASELHWNSVQIKIFLYLHTPLPSASAPRSVHPNARLPHPSTPFCTTFPPTSHEAAVTREAERAREAETQPKACSERFATENKHAEGPLPHTRHVCGPAWSHVNNHRPKMPLATLTSPTKFRYVPKHRGTPASVLALLSAFGF